MDGAIEPVFGLVISIALLLAAASPAPADSCSATLSDSRPLEDDPASLSSVHRVKAFVRWLPIDD